MDAKNLIVCWSCKAEVPVSSRVSRNDTCPSCDQPLKCCYNCKFYDRDAHHQCLESQAEWVRYKEKANFCEWFVPKGKPEPVTEKQPETTEAEAFSLSRQSKARFTGNKKDRDKAAWDSLFKD